MVAVEIRTPFHDEEAGEIVWRGLAFVRADADTLEIYGDDTVVDPEIPVIDLATGKQLRGTDDPETWARNLPQAFRGGDLVAAVVIDTDPPELESSSSQELPRIPAPPAATRLVDGATLT